VSVVGGDRKGAVTKHTVVGLVHTVVGHDLHRGMRFGGGGGGLMGRRGFVSMFVVDRRGEHTHTKL